ncbi:LLM class flavin-dependent oxidoreductase [Angustibacter aerolatus]
MTDYGHQLQLGTFVTPSADAVEHVLEAAVLTELVGLDLVTFQDHPYQARHLDVWTLLSVVGARTSSVRLAANVLNLPLRPPWLVARSVATLDLLTGGRVELGLGAGAFWDAIAAVGGERRTPGEAVDALEEAVEVIRAAWDTSRRSVRFAGDHYPVAGAHPGPAPAHDVEIWLGAYKPRMLRLTGARADGWLPSMGYADPPDLPAMHALVDEAAVEAGRSPADVRRLYNVFGTFGRGDGWLTGTPRDWAEKLAGLTIEQGISTFVLGTDDLDVIRRFGGEVAPEVRRLVEAERADPRPPVATEPDREVAAAESITVAPTSAFAVRTTPDDGRRLSATRVWDESARPTGPAPDPARTYTADDLARGRHLVDVHDHLRQELRTVRDLVDQVEAGLLDVGSARTAINEMTMRQNNWTLGAYCESYCRVVTTHHTIEDRSMFPRLRAGDPSLSPVIDRLELEHHAIHDVLEGVDRALVDLVARPDGLPALREAVNLLSDTLLSHLSYEERELVEPLARMGFA